ncbi:hypothetical protein PU629_06445 [Pullulanibacillus sp. KACC 23026]|uniref:hypothetical protein n=1 Tax=Pullulanibacillus sp. KACC 23026 TaxID=3028315 RepID=UPI0023B042C7|nr:hypothetical protein [Pullulanibacillus sp. KACC 23026]WEG14004.1 hypothetical protein PU629_06445 [Pullulanibacillus sp. KACC 23026]
MDFEDALKSELATIPDLTNRIFPLTGPEGQSAPYVVYALTDDVQERTLDGYIFYREITCELHILHSKYFSLSDLKRQITSLIDSFQRRVIGGDNGLFVQSATYEKVNEMYLPDLLQYLCVLEMKVSL